MKKILFLLVLAFGISNLAIAQTETPVATQIEVTSGPRMIFEDGNTNTTVDYGTLEQHGEPLRVVNFTNTGTEPLVIKNARGSCGCTVPTWPKEPILPGETSKIEIRYATNRLGKINKNVTITTNENGELSTHKINVVGNVLKPESEESAPSSKPGVIIGDN
jgi:hypothetical protein